MNEEKFVEIALVYKIEEEYLVEKVYAIKTGEYFQLKAIPAFAGIVAYDDMIMAVYEEGTLYFEKHIESSGHSVIHVVILKTQASANIFSELLSYGVNINYLHNNTYLAIDIPSHVVYTTLKSYLDKELRLGNLEYSEACLSDLHNPYI